MNATVHLDAASVEAIARRVAELLDGKHADPEDPAMVDAAEIARRFGVSRDFAYRHATRLGAVRLGDGPHARLRFDPARVAERLATNGTNGPDPVPPRAPAPARRRPSAPSRDLLPIRQTNRRTR